MRMADLIRRIFENHKTNEHITLIIFLCIYFLFENVKQIIQNL